jgi:hypothetical protein
VFGSGDRSDGAVQEILEESDGSTFKHNFLFYSHSILHKTNPNNNKYRKRSGFVTSESNITL